MEFLPFFCNTFFSVQYFVQVACPPYSVEALKGFLRLLQTPPSLLKDCTNIVDMELVSVSVSSLHIMSDSGETID